VFTTSVGTKMLAGNVHGDFRRAPAHVPGIDPSDWTPRELRHSFVSVLSDAGVPVEESLPACRSQRYDRDRARLPASAEARDPDRSNSDGPPAIRAKVRTCVGSQCAAMHFWKERNLWLDGWA
jgi:hypothetical protein